MFKKNLESINNESLKTRLLALNLDDTRQNMSYCMTPSNDYLLMKNDIPLDDIENPRTAVQEMCKNAIKQQMNTNDIIIIFGIGLGYILDEVFNTYPSRIYLYEPDTELLHFVLNNVDISEHMSSGRVFLSDKLDEITEKLSQDYITKDKVEIVYLKNYAVVKSRELLELTQKVYETCKSKMVDVNTITKFSQRWAVNTLKNISNINKKSVYRLSDLEDKFIGQTALIIAAGPSLRENIEKIKANREKFVIFAVNKVLKEILKEGIIPDFVVCLDAGNLEKTFNGVEDYLPKINCICDIKTSDFIFEENFKKVFVSFSENDMIVKSLKAYNPEIKTYECGGSASTMALVIADKMGFTKIVYTGLDLAFKDDVAYASGDVINKISDTQINAENAVKNLTTVKSVTGGEVTTRDDYAAFIKHFETIIKELKIVDIYNTTSFGAAIEGMINVPFDRVILNTVSNATSIILGGVSEFKLNTSEWGQNELFTINNIITMLSKEEFSPALVSSIVKSPIMYQYMQAEILRVLQAKMNMEQAEEFMQTAKKSIKEIIDLLQKGGII